MKAFLVLCEAALIVVAVCCLGIPEARTGVVYHLFHVLWLIVGVAWIVQMHKAGVLGMTPSQTYQTSEARPKLRTTMLVALILSFITSIFMSLN